MFKFVFFGSPRFARIALEQMINAGMKPVLVVCNPDRPAGRKLVITAPETKVLAEKHNIEVFQPESLKDIPPAGGWPIDWAEIDFSIVAAYSQIIPKSIIELPRFETLGIHPSWLPKYRGASPIQSVLINGEELTAVTIYQMDEKLDHGPTLWGKPIEIAKNETYLSLEEKLAIEGGKGMAEIANDFMAGKIEAREQNHEIATFTKKFETKDGEVDMAKHSAIEIYRKIQALNPEPGVYTFNFPSREKKRVKLLEAQMKDGELKVTKIQEAGKNPMDLKS